jgi:hypothetical protein
VTCHAARGLLAYSAVFCAQHRLSHKLMMEAAATRKHLQVDQCAYHFVDEFSERRVASRDTSLQRVVAQAFPSAQQDLVDVAFASPPSPSQLRLLQVPTHTSIATATAKTATTTIAQTCVFILIIICPQQLLLVAFPDQVARICKQQSGSKRREYDVCSGAEGPFVVASHSQLRHASHDYIVYGHSSPQNTFVL